MSFELGPFVFSHFSNRETDKRGKSRHHVPPIPSLSGVEDSDADMQRKVSLGLLGFAGNDAFNLLANSSVSRWL